jgi:hypothetical protein
MAAADASSSANFSRSASLRAMRDINSEGFVFASISPNTSAAPVSGVED